MSTRIIFDVESDDPEIQTACEGVRDDPVLLWKLAIFCCQMQLEKAVAARAIRDHYDAIHLRARATREARKEIER